jgi:hypothetical protein
MRPLSKIWHAYWQWNRGVTEARGGWFYAGAIPLTIIADLLPRPAPGPARVLVACVLAITLIQLWLLILSWTFKNAGEAG